MLLVLSLSPAVVEVVVNKVRDLLTHAQDWEAEAKLALKQR